jgi:hypothetical protein
VLESLRVSTTCGAHVIKSGGLTTSAVNTARLSAYRAKLPLNSCHSAVVMFSVLVAVYLTSNASAAPSAAAAAVVPGA